MIPFPDKKYKIIYADPPWEYNNYSNKEGSKYWSKSQNCFRGTKQGITPYHSMSIDEIKSLTIPAAADSILFLWVTFPCLEWGLDVIKAWGFTYKTIGFNWVKKNRGGVGWYLGLGNYTRANSEICLIATKGKGVPIIDKTISQICDAPLKQHSKKPDIIRQKIVQLCGDLPRIELFARTKVHGWDVWGNDEKLKAKPLEDFL